MKNKLLALALTALVALPAVAGELKGVEVPDRITLDGQELVLNGMALRKVAIISIYVAALYLPERQSDADALLASDAVRQLQMHWLRGTTPDRVCNGWYEGLAANTPNASDELKAQFDTLCDYMPAPEADQVLSFTYRPGQGTEVRVNDTVQGVIPGKEFADALWRCWIGPDPGPGAKFKSDLLGA